MPNVVFGDMKYGKYNIHSVTWNVNGCRPPDVEILSNFFGDDLEYSCDIIFIGLQEVQQYNPKILFWTSFNTDVAAKVGSHEMWEDVFSQCLGEKGFALIDASSEYGLSNFTFVAKQYLPFISNISSSFVRFGFLGLFGNKGSLGVRFDFFDTSMCFITSHFTPHMQNLSNRVDEHNMTLELLTFHLPTSGNVEYYCDVISHDVIVWLGDFNFRVTELSVEAANDILESRQYSELIVRDQLTQLLADHVIFDGFRDLAFLSAAEPKEYFPICPSYKLDDVRYKVDETHLPSYTDRIFVSAVGLSTADSTTKTTDLKNEKDGDELTPVTADDVRSPTTTSLDQFCHVIEYRCAADMAGFSDHLPVTALFVVDVAMVTVTPHNPRCVFSPITACRPLPLKFCITSPSKYHHLKDISLFILPKTFVDVRTAVAIEFDAVLTRKSSKMTQFEALIAEDECPQDNHWYCCVVTDSNDRRNVLGISPYFNFIFHPSAVVKDEDVDDEIDKLANELNDNNLSNSSSDDSEEIDGRLPFENINLIDDTDSEGAEDEILYSKEEEETEDLLSSCLKRNITTDGGVKSEHNDLWDDAIDEHKSCLVPPRPPLTLDAQTLVHEALNALNIAAQEEIPSSSNHHQYKASFDVKDIRPPSDEDEDDDDVDCMAIPVDESKVAGLSSDSDDERPAINSNLRTTSLRARPKTAHHRTGRHFSSIDDSSMSETGRERRRKMVTAGRSELSRPFFDCASFDEENVSMERRTSSPKSPPAPEEFKETKPVSNDLFWSGVEGRFSYSEQQQPFDFVEGDNMDMSEEGSVSVADE